MKTIQKVILASLLLLAVGLYWLSSPSTEYKSTEVPHNREASSFRLSADLHSLIEQEKKQLPAVDLQKINETELSVTKTISAAEANKILAEAWENINNSYISSIYRHFAALESQTEKDYLSAADALAIQVKSAKSAEETAALSRLAIEDYEAALNLNPEDLNTKARLGACIVRYSDNPMKGILLLREVVEKAPFHIEANMYLGEFSIQSGQLEKAEKRFKTVIEVYPHSEAYYWLGEYYRLQGNMPAAEAAYQKASRLKDSIPTVIR